ncbi:hypothetical protein K435DRAFT_867138 [Dendrothele bispora CBS 962.96]|uniref:Family A G protein-coupled receptor-like protein n=1 Tax=Dendrothele bispora (strain CBS 962.96) TaxID=1314807 RepID=A0A4S8LFW8_DENBC|nr:hypothetical protein K435DRAFT_867138 [Dendrothele bispora CBS 962.96]
MLDPLSDQDPQCTEIIQSTLLKIWPTVIFLVVMFLIYGIYLTVTLFAGYVLLARGIRNSKPRLVLFVITVFELLLSTAYVVVILVVDSLIFFEGLSPEWYQHRLHLGQQVDAGLGFVFLLSDGIVVWRTWVLFPFNTLIKSTLAFCILVATVCTCVDGGVTASRSASDIQHRGSGGAAAQNLLMSLPLLITNALATALVGYKAWSHRKDIKQNLRSTETTMSKALKTLWLLIESGLVYCIIWMAYIIVIETGPNSGDAYGSSPAWTFANIIPLLAALFPSLVTLVAALEDTKEPGNNGDNGSLSQSIRFASENAAASATNVSMTRSGGVLEVDLQDRGITFARSLSADTMEIIGTSHQK